MKTTAPLLALALLTSFASAENWPNWRGPEQNGTSGETGLPVKFSPQEGVKWAADVPGISASVPVIWGDHVFITAPIAAEKKLIGLCYDKQTGKEKWRVTISEGDEVQWDDKSNLASPSPATDGDRVYFLFANAVAAACDFGGKIVWKRDFKETHGAFGTQWTYGSSPTIDSGKLYIQVLQRNEPFEFHGFNKGTPGKDMSSYVLAIDPATGKDIWKVIRPSTAKIESLEAFSSPVFTTYKDQRLMLISGGDTLTIHDAVSGREFSRMATWNPPGEGYNSFFRLVPSPVVGDGIAIVCAPKNSPVFAMPLDAKGETQPLWQTEPKGVTSDVPTPAFYKGHFYILDGGKKILSCLEPKTGKVVWSGELGGKTKFESSPTVADDKVYCINFWGEVYVAKANTDKFELLAVNEMGNGSKPNGNAESVRASISVSDGSLFIRNQEKLFRVGK
ncbi:MAG: PQQ-binding-like beta-propeller repeat protein [Verrucomicrobiaceae bacterium]|jgi:outer membrane protein assembly factor BamB|nr:PQQ-binding-like beta-propeller repeat protein [Verrucomicrobiaceae bacterium]